MAKSSPVPRSASTASFSSSSSSAGARDNGGNGSSIPTALPTHEAVRILLSPDGYYEYLGIPKPTEIVDAAVSGHGSNSNANTATNADPSIDLERVKKNYRRLSLKHHPDRRTGNAEAFRMLNRAKIVLSNSKLRREYDLLGLDLDDDAEDEEDEDGGGGGGGDADEEAEETAAEIPQEEGDDAIHCTDHNGNDESAKRDTNEGTHRRRPTKSPAAKTYVGGTRSGKQHEKDNNNKSNGNNGGGGGGGSKTETVMGHLASASLAAVLQVVVRTGLMSVVSVLISRYVILTYLAIGTLTFLSYKLYTSLKKTLSGSNAKVMTWSTAKESFSPLVIAFGIYCMYRGRRFVMMATPDTATTTTIAAMKDASAPEDDVGRVLAVAAVVAATTYLEWSWTFWLGETIVMTSFLCNSFEKQTRGLVMGFGALSLLLSLWLRGKFWRYNTLLGLEAFVAMLIVVAFPIMEMILESIVEEKMKKVGEKIRAHDKRMKELLRKEQERASSERR